MFSLVINNLNNIDYTIISKIHIIYVQIDYHRAQELEEQLLSIRSELEKSDQTIHELNRKVESYHTENFNFRSQNEESEKRLCTQEAEIQSLENELRVAHSDDAITKANFNHQR